MAKESSAVVKKDRQSKAGKRSKTFIAGSPSPMPENAYLHEEIQRLRKETEQRAAELALINSVQEGLAAGLTSDQGMQAIYDLVGDKIREIFHNADVEIRTYDSKTNLVHYPYITDDGERIKVDPVPLTNVGFSSYVLRTGETLVINENFAQEVEKYGTIPVPGGHLAKSAAFVPLVVGDQVRGVIIIADMKREHAFSPSDVRLLQTLANSMSVALENARLFDETQHLLKETEQSNAELAIINSVQEGLAAGMTSNQGMQAIYDLVGDKIREIFHNTDTEIRTYDPKTNLVYFPYITENGERTAVDSTPLPDFGMSAYVLRTGETVVINENIVEEMKRYGSQTFLPGTQYPSKSAVFVPLVVGGQVLGLIVLGNVEREHAFSDSDVRLLQTLGSSMSVALENARLFDETQHLLKETDRRATELAIINSVQEGLASKLDMQAIYDLVGDKIHDLFNAQSILIVTFDPTTRTREIKYNFEKGQRYYISELFPYNKLTEHLIETKKTVVINGDAEARIAEFGMVTSPGTETLKSGVFVPLLAGEEVKGFISVQNVELENAFSESDVNLLSTFASSMSVALENARLYQEQLQVADELKRVDRMKTQFLSSMSHELRTPLNAIINFVEMMARGMIGPVNPDQEELLNQTLDSSKHLLHLINDVLDISKIQAGRLALFLEDGVNLQEEVEGILNIVSGLAQEKGLQLVRDIDPHLPIIACDRRRLRQVFLNLLGNAIKFTEQGTVTLSAKNRRQEVLFAVIDTGPGISPAKQELIFEPFMQAGEGEKEIQGTGLGLPISRSLVQAHGGKLWLESQSGEGTAFFFTLPLHERRAA
jgi:signal transduction histidine kinase/dsRNA-specific ribonuclease